MSSVQNSILANLGSTASTTSTSTAKKSSTSLGMDDFLNLLMKQMQYQDPMNPMDNSQFIAQTAQFSQVQALSDMKTSLENLSNLQTSINNIQALSFIGKNVSAKGSNLEYSGNPLSLNFTTTDDAAEFGITIYDSKGSQVRSVTIAGADAGSQSYTWDGKNGNGATVANGAYTYKVEAMNSLGNAIPATTYTNGAVTGVRYDNGVTYLTVGKKEVTIADIQKIVQ